MVHDAIGRIERLFAGQPVKEDWGKERWVVAIQGQCVECWVHDGNPFPMPPIKRGTIDGFSRQSRMRLLRFNAKVDWKKIRRGIFVSLTYPDRRVFVDYKMRTQQRSMFMRKLEWRLGRHVPSIWRCEWKPRQSGELIGVLAPHFHLILPGVAFIAHEFIRKAWRDILQIDGPLATDVRKLKNPEMCGRYVTKYCAKLPSLDISAYLNTEVTTGRQWGVTRPKEIPMCSRVYYGEIAEEEIEAVRQEAKKDIAGFGTPRERGFTVFGAEPATRYKKLLY